ncbi:flagellar hook protein FlgE [Caldimonas brevitalea]|uniref:Flagellar hook protein FlgE n=1 Tax=Caldimonas brevitalea TaxID=413882 RepID=A0A0G3BSJ2_9BURK|nr:flagellar hook protein FlgE [Caldimonas brevitalea]AKJ30973.1 flagellar hook protein FlgE [Caldimonas brevitalea]
MGFQQGLSGLNASSKNLDVIGNNVANAGTFGAKSARAEFADMYASAMNGAGANSIGIGVQLASVAQQFTQGNITTTENSLDLAVNGSGFFQVADIYRDPNAAPTAPPQVASPPMYSRNGQFKLDRSGYIVNNQNQALLGYMADTNGLIAPQQARPLQLPTAGINPQATNAINLEFNLDSRAGVTQPAAGSINFTDPLTYNNATSVTVYDAKGQDVALTYYFQKTNADTWDVFATANGDTLLADGGGNPAPIATISYPPNTGGNPVAPDGSVQYYLAGGGTSTDGRIPLEVPATTKADGSTTLAITGLTLDMNGATQYGTTFGVTNLTQNGYAAGQLVGVTIDDSGIVMARFSNGQSKPAAQLELATFRNPQGLQPLGGNAWAATYASGDPTLSVPGSGSMGVLQSGALEESNVDLTAELVNMITAQRAYQANAQTIRTQDQVLQTLVSLR